MHVGIISDIHGNCVALEAVLADLREQRVDQILCLGDVIQGGPQPAETAALLQELACPIVMGNADAWLLTGESSGTEPVGEQQIAVREWSLAHLSAEDCAFIRSFQPTISISFDTGQRLLCFHGSPASFDDIILPETPNDAVFRLLGQTGAQFLTGGHTHLQQIRRVGEALFFNPGSVGLAYSRKQPDNSIRVDPWAEYALLSVDDDGRVGLAFRRVPFDVEALIHVYETSGRPFTEEAIAQYRHATPKTT